MASIITTSLVVQFDDQGGDILKAEIDSRVDGYNNGETSFSPGEEPAFLIYKTSNVVVTSITPSTGSIQILSNSVVISKVETLNFEDKKSVTTQYPVVSGLSYIWLGTSLGALTVSGQNTLIAANKGVAVAKVTYNTVAMARRLTGVATSLNGETSFPVLIYIVGEPS